MMSKKEEIIRGYVEGLVEDERIAAEKYASAQPVYYGIWTCEDIVTQPGYEEGYGRFFETEEWGEGMTPREAFAWVVENAGVSDKDLEYAFFYKPPVTLAYLEEHDGVLPESVDDAEIVAFLSEKYGDVLDYLPLLHIGKVAPNAMFLTEREARKHFEKNDYHYSEDAHIYAMSAWRNPALREFLQTLKDIDFDRSTFVFKSDDADAGTGAKGAVEDDGSDGDACDRCGECKK